MVLVSVFAYLAWLLTVWRCATVVPQITMALIAPPALIVAKELAMMPSLVNLEVREPVLAILALPIPQMAIVMSASQDFTVQAACLALTAPGAPCVIKGLTEPVNVFAKQVGLAMAMAFAMSALPAIMDQTVPPAFTVDLMEAVIRD